MFVVTLVGKDNQPQDIETDKEGLINLAMLTLGPHKGRIVNIIEDGQILSFRRQVELTLAATAEAEKARRVVA